MYNHDAHVPSCVVASQTCMGPPQYQFYICASNCLFILFTFFNLGLYICIGYDGAMFCVLLYARVVTQCMCADQQQCIQTVCPEQCTIPDFPFDTVHKLPQAFDLKNIIKLDSRTSVNGFMFPASVTHDGSQRLFPHDPSPHAHFGYRNYTHSSGLFRKCKC